MQRRGRDIPETGTLDGEPAAPASSMEQIEKKIYPVRVSVCEHSEQNVQVGDVMSAGNAPARSCPPNSRKHDRVVVPHTIPPQKEKGTRESAEKPDITSLMVTSALAQRVAVAPCSTGAELNTLAKGKCVM